MLQRFVVPAELRPMWHVLASQYQEYLPDIQMEDHWFVALPEQAHALFSELEEMISTELTGGC